VTQARTPTLAEVAAAVHRRYDPAWAEPWDAVGLVCGDPEAPVRRILLAVDPVAATAQEALGLGADLLLTHHPLLLRPVSSVAATTPAGRLLHRLIGGGVALLAAHTNADSAPGGVSDALAGVAGLGEVDPLVPAPGPGTDKSVVFVPAEHLDAVLDAVHAAGAGVIGDYDRCASVITPTTGRFRPLPGAEPFLGEVGTAHEVAESRVEFVAPRSRREVVVAALRGAHPYDEPAYDVLELVPAPSGVGLGRVGDLDDAVTLGALAERVAAGVPATAQGVRVAGDLDREVRRIAVCGGSGSDLIGAARAAGADVLVTADLKHHQVLDARELGDLALVDLAHWASEWPWLPRAADRLVADLAAGGATVEVHVSELVTDPWTARR
jgi:dinuclear metal center YbgI/SA1388 family protein